MPRVPCVSLLSQARTKPPRAWPNVSPSRRVAIVLPAPPFGLTTVIWRRPPKARRAEASAILPSRSRRLGRSRTSPKLLRRAAALTPVVATQSRGRTARRVANSSAVGTAYPIRVGVSGSARAGVSGWLIGPQLSNVGVDPLYDAGGTGGRRDAAGARGPVDAELTDAELTDAEPTGRVGGCPSGGAERRGGTGGRTGGNAGSRWGEACRGAGTACRGAATGWSAVTAGCSAVTAGVRCTGGRRHGESGPKSAFSSSLSSRLSGSSGAMLPPPPRKTDTRGRAKGNRAVTRRTVPRLRARPTRTACA